MSKPVWVHEIVMLFYLLYEWLFSWLSFYLLVWKQIQICAPGFKLAPTMLISSTLSIQPQPTHTDITRESRSFPSERSLFGPCLFQHSTTKWSHLLPERWLHLYPPSPCGCNWLKDNKSYNLILLDTVSQIWAFLLLAEHSVCVQNPFTYLHGLCCILKCMEHCHGHLSSSEMLTD